MVLKIQFPPLQVVLDLREADRSAKGLDAYVQPKSLPSLDVSQWQVSM